MKAPILRIAWSTREAPAKTLTAGSGSARDTQVHLSEFAVTRLHCFRRRAALHLAPITLVFGQNNAGKSTLLRAMSLLAASVGSPTSAALDLSCEAARGANYHDLRSRHDLTNEMTFDVSWESDDAVAANFTVRLMEEPGGGHVVKALSFSDATHAVDLQVSTELVGVYELVRDRAVGWSGVVPFEGIKPCSGYGQTDQLRAALEHLGDHLGRLQKSVQWLAAVRHPAPRKQQIMRGETARGSDGRWAQDRLIRDVVDGRSELLAVVSKEMEALFGCSLHIDIDGDEAMLRATPRGVAWRVPLADLGEGIVQVLPVLVLCCMAERGDLGDGPILCMEQPEMHLHTDAERALTALLSRVARSATRPTLVLESHSEILLSALLLEVAEGRLARTALSAHWVSKESLASESVVEHVALDEKGRPEWPVGAFGDRTALARELFIARRR